MSLTLTNINELLSIGLTIVSIAAGAQAKFHFDNKFTKQILTAAFAAEKAIDKTAYNNDGTLNAAREDMALLILSKINPSISHEDAKLELESVLKTIHAHAEDGAELAANDPKLVTKPELGVSPTPGPVPPGVVPPTPTAESVSVSVHENG